jgi:putative spermidine/putrescine transport system substrate-binding protein
MEHEGPISSGFRVLPKWLISSRVACRDAGRDLSGLTSMILASGVGSGAAGIVSHGPDETTTYARRWQMASRLRFERRAQRVALLPGGGTVRVCLRGSIEPGMSELRPCQLRRNLARRRLCGGALLAMPAILTRPARAAGRPITFAGYGDWFQEAFETLVLDEFRKTHPEVEVFYYPVGNSFQGLTLLREQRGFPATDVMLLEAGVAAQANEERLLDPLDVGSMPVMKDLVPQAILSGLPGPALVLDSLALGFAPATSGQPPRAWRNLWDPGFSARIALQTPPDPTGLAMTVVAAALFGGGDAKTALDVAVSALSRLAPRVVLWDPFPDITSAIAGADAGIGPVWNARAQQLISRRFAVAVPEDGTPCLATTVNLVKGARQPDAARTLIAWLLGPEGQRRLVETMFYGPVNARLDLPAASLARAGATPAMVGRRIGMDWIGITQMRGQITEAWRRYNLGKH